MKAFTVEVTKLDQFLKTNKSPIRIFLIYGQDDGGVLLTTRKIINLALRKEDSIANSINTSSYSDISAEPHILNDFFQSASLFASKSVMVINECSENINKEILSILSDRAQHSDNIVIFCAGDIKKSSKIVKSFEALERVLIIPCYKLDHYNASLFIANYLNYKDISYDRLVPNSLASIFPADRLLIENELKKLILYADKRAITINDIEEVFHHYTKESSIDLLCNAICDQQDDKIIFFLDTLIKNDNHPLMIIRSLQNYFSRLLQVRVLLDQGSNLQDAISSLNPPLFFKQKDSFIINVNKVSLELVKIYIKDLLEVEMSIKSSHLISIQTMIEKALQKKYISI